MMVYYAHPIDQASTDGPANTVVRATDEVLATALDVAVYSPSNAWSASGLTPPNHRLQDVNMMALHGADVMVVALPAGVPTLGVPIEMHIALERLRLPVIVHTDLTHSWVLAWLVQQGDLRVVQHDATDFPGSTDRLAAEFNRVLVGANR